MNMKKNILAAILALASSGVFATTLNPVQLLNPTGSSSGQTIVSTGASTAPGWANLSVGNVTGAAPLASPALTGLVTITNSGSTGDTLTIIASSDTSQGADILLQGNGGTTPNKRIRAFGGAFQVVNSGNTNAIISSDDSGNLTLASGLVGTTTNNNATAGNVGEFVTATGTTVSMTNATATNITSISLTAGDWDVSGGIQWNPAGSTTVSLLRGSTSLTSATNGTFDASILLAPTNGFLTGQVQMTGVPTTRYSLSSTTTIYLVGTPTFGVSTMTASGVIRARRIR